MGKFLIIALLVAPLTACISAEERLAKDKSYATKDCRDFGYKLGSTEHTQCVERGIRDIRKDRQKALEDLAKSLNPPTIRCTSNTYGYSTTTTCR